MTTFVTDSKGQIQELDIFDLLPPDEGEIDIFYGRIGGGKTTAGTRNIMSELKRGLVIYANWRLNWQGYDEREKKGKLLKGFFGLKKVYYKIPKENFHFWNLQKSEIDNKSYREYFNCFDEVFRNEKGELREMNFTDVLSRLTDCSVHLDEGHIPFDSYEATRMSEQKRSAVFAMRHYDRKLTVYTQRANSVHINLRGNANRFYKCEKTFDHTFFKHRLIHFLITEFQDLESSGAVDETLEIDEEGNEVPFSYRKSISHERYWGNDKLFSMFDSKYLRGDAKHSQPNNALAFFPSWKEIRQRLFGMESKRLLDTPPLPPVET